MKTRKILILGAVAALSLSGWMKSGWPADGSKVYYNFEPLFRYSIVSGDKEKFREDMGISDKAAGGINEFSLSQNSKDMKVEADARAIVDENDYDFNASVEKENLFKIASGYKEFRKYYDGTGGFYSWFKNRPFIELNNDLVLNDAKFFIDLSSDRPDKPNYFVTYERHVKTGAVSTLGWASDVQQVGVGQMTRKISPGFEQLDEVEHTIKLGTEGNTILSKDAHWKVEQKLIYFNGKFLTEERKYGLGTSAATALTANAIDAEDSRPKSNSSITTLLADTRINKWLYVSSQARYEHTHASLLEDFTERDPNGFIRSVGTLNYFNQTASNTLDVYTWAASMLADPLKYLSASAKIKGEVKKRFSDSVMPQDTTAIPNMVIDRVTKVDSSDTYSSIGESLGVRFTKLPRTTLYLDGDFEQIHGRLTQESVREVPLSTFNRDVDIIRYRNNATAGINWHPCNVLSVSSQYRKVFNKNNYSQREGTPPTATTDYLDLLDAQKFDNDTLMAKVDIKPYKWIHGMFKYELRNNDIFTTPNGLDSTKATQDINTYLASVTLIPTQYFYLTGMFSRRSSFMDTPARLATVACVPRYEADVNTAAGSATYIITPRASLGAQYQWVHSSNFNDISAFGMPYGLDNTSNRASLTFKYDIKQDLLTEIMYSFVNYDEKSNGGIDDYVGHIIGGKVMCAF